MSSDLALLRVVLDVQHAFRGGRHVRDRGAVFRRRSGLSVTEVELALAYSATVAAQLRAQGAEVFENDPSGGTMVGSYLERAMATRAIRAHAYLACHVNAGGGDYARCSYRVNEPPAGDALHWSRVHLAQDIAGEIDAEFAMVRRARTIPLARADRGWVCIGHVRPPTAAVLVEPFFGDRLEQLEELAASSERLAELGGAIARGVRLWWLRQQLRAGVPV